LDDNLITFFVSSGGQAGSLAPLCRQLMADAIVDHMETQVRNAFLSLPVRYIVGGGTGFGDIGASDVFDPDLAMDISLEFMYNQVMDPNSPNGVNAVAFASPGQIYTAQQDADYKAIAQYSEIGARSLLRYEMGQYKGLRYVQVPQCTLYNMGVITAQAGVSAAIDEGDGCLYSTKVLDTYKQGQHSGVTSYIQLGTLYSGAIGDFNVGDVVTIHTLRSDGATQPYTVVNAPYATDGTITNRRIVSIDEDNKRLTFDRPIQKAYGTALDDGNYAYVTKGLHIHACIVAAGAGAVVGGFAQPPKLMFPPAIDDREAMYRVTWDSVHGYGLFRPEMAAIIFSSGYVSSAGYKKLGNT